MTSDEAKSAAIELLKKILADGAWYHSAIELSKQDGEDLEREARRIIRDTNGETRPRIAVTDACMNRWRQGQYQTTLQPHSDPDGAGQCIYCQCVLIELAGVDY